MTEILAAYNREDWACVRANLADELMVVDHRPAPALYDGVSGPDEFVAALQPLFDLAAGIAVRVNAVDVVGARAAVVQLRTHGVMADGGDFELAFQLAYVVEVGKVTRLEFFADDSLADARARLTELMATDEG